MYTVQCTCVCREKCFIYILVGHSSLIWHDHGLHNCWVFTCWFLSHPFHVPPLPLHCMQCTPTQVFLIPVLGFKEDKSTGICLMPYQALDSSHTWGFFTIKEWDVTLILLIFHSVGNDALCTMCGLITEFLYHLDSGLLRHSYKALVSSCLWQLLVLS